LILLAKLLTKHSSELEPLLYKSAELCRTPRRVAHFFGTIITRFALNR
jgi:hypothetical protein